MNRFSPFVVLAAARAERERADAELAAILERLGLLA